MMTALLVAELARAAAPTEHAERISADGGTAPVVERRPEGLWPQPAQVHPALAALTEADQASIEAVAKRVVALEPESAPRVKALHDWVVRWLTYEREVDGKRVPQDAEIVFKRRTAACEGYARLFAALCTAAGVKVEYLTGLALEEGATHPTWHAWNAVWLDGGWKLVDPTFDDPLITGDAPGDNYRTDYLFIPPEVAVLDHLPREAKWQLVDKPVNQAQFLAPGRSRPAMVRQGLTLVSTERTVKAGVPLVVRLTNINGRHVIATLDGARCELSSAKDLALKCPAPARGSHRVQVLTHTAATGLFLSVLSYDVEAQ